MMWEKATLELMSLKNYLKKDIFIVKKEKQQKKNQYSTEGYNISTIFLIRHPLFPQASN